MTATLYQLTLAFHLIAVVFWLAALFYLPRLFVYHADLPPEAKDTHALFCLMEARLLKIIATPSMIAAWIFGLVLFAQADWGAGWLWSKLVLVLALSGYHGACAKWRKGFLTPPAAHNSAFFRKINEIAPLLAIFIIFLVILKPF